MKKTKIFNNKILAMILFSLFLRLFLSFFGTLELDLNTFIAWSTKVSRHGFQGFYDSWCDYLPGYIYILWLLGKISTIVPQGLLYSLYKLPAILADLATGALIYKILEGKGYGKKALFGSLIYIFNPAIIVNSTLWGQVDSLTSFFSMLAVFLISKNYILSALSLAVAGLIKPQAAAASLAVLYVIYKKRWKVKKVLTYIFISAVFFVLGFLPFTGLYELPAFIIDRFNATLNQYPYTSINAFNFWALKGMWIRDVGQGLELNNVGWILFVVVALSSFIYALRKKMDLGVWKLLAVLFLASFLFPTRVHERHLLPALAPIALLSVLNPKILVIYIGLSITYLANLYYSFIWVTQDFKEVIPNLTVKIISSLNIVYFTLLIKNLNSVGKAKLNNLRKLNISYNRLNLKGGVDAFPKINVLLKNKANIAISVILIFTLFSRTYNLHFPQNEYFDEVYHVFTAKLVLHSDPKAWEWWNPHPEGFAYEWTHPPISKLAMALGMKLFGETSLGWRLPQALAGTLSVLFVYLLSVRIFKDKWLGVIASAVYSLDGLNLVLSRMGMNDTYLVLFILISLYLFLGKKNFGSSVLFGLALASKWSAIWAVPIYLFIFVVEKRKIELSHIWFFVVPPLVYISSYLFMFLTGHDFSTFIEVQKQMWWYHTNLKATHAYTSPWWSWPLLMRPIWLFTDSKEGLYSNIYATGNPAIAWGGIYFIVVGVLIFLKNKSKNLLITLFAYFVFFTPWALSPRIMFLYHYLPSMPFLAIITAYIIRLYINKYSKWILAFFLISLVLFVYFYPRYIGFYVPAWLNTSYVWFESWK